jgi:hypothetical protein
MMDSGPRDWLFVWWIVGRVVLFLGFAALVGWWVIVNA